MDLLYKGAWALMLVGLVGMLSCSSDDNFIFDPSPTIFGSGTIVQETRTVSGATGVNMGAVAKLTVEKGAPERIELQTDDNLMARILTEVQGGILVIRHDPTVTVQSSQRMEAHLRLGSIDTIMLTGVGEIRVPDLTTNQLALTMSGVGDIAVTNLVAQSLDVQLSGVGGISASGQVDDQQITVSGVGDYDAENLSSRTADVLISSISSATVRVSTTLNVTFTGSGSVFYHGSPVVTITGTGSVTQVTP